MLITSLLSKVLEIHISDFLSLIILFDFEEKNHEWKMGN